MFGVAHSNSLQEGEHSTWVVVPSDGEVLYSISVLIFEYCMGFLNGPGVWRTLNQVDKTTLCTYFRAKFRGIGRCIWNMEFTCFDTFFLLSHLAPGQTQATL